MRLVKLREAEENLQLLLTQAQEEPVLIASIAGPSAVVFGIRGITREQLLTASRAELISMLSPGSDPSKSALEGLRSACCFCERSGPDVELMLGHTAAICIQCIRNLKEIIDEVESLTP